MSGRLVLILGRLPRYALLALLAAASLFALYLPVNASLRFESQKDFRSYYFAGRAAADGLDPYDLQTLHWISDERVTLPFLYMPLVLPGLELLQRADLEAAHHGYFLLKAVAGALLLLLWYRGFVRGRIHPLAYLIFVMLSFNLSLHKDLLAGNVAVFEALLLFTGFHFFVQRERAGPFYALVLAASLLKLAPAFFLLVPCVYRLRENLRGTALALLAFVALNVGVAAAMPEHYGSFLAGATAVDERGAQNPASLALIRDLLGFLGPAAATLADELVHLGWVIGVVAVCAWLLRGVSLDRYAATALTTFVYALIAPRMKDYSFLLLIPFALTLLLALRPRLGAGLALFTVAGFHAYPHGLFPYHASVLALMSLALLLVGVAPAASGWRARLYRDTS